jgi:uncharacterized cupin superfamily protein
MIVVSTTLVKAIKATATEVGSDPLAPWGRRPEASGEAATRGRKLLDHDGLPAAGIWACTPGSWTVSDRQDTEVSVVLSGRGRITDADGEAREIEAGDLLILPLGWSGQWEILEPLRKIYVVVPG